MTERETILSLLRLGWSERRIARECGYHRATIQRVRREAGLEGSKCTTPGKVPTDPLPSDGEVPADPPAATRSSAEPFRDFIEAEIAKRRNSAAIYQDLVERHGYSGSYDAVKRLARKLRGSLPKVSCRFETEPGQEAQVDYGEGALTRDPRTGRYRRPRLFVMTLGNSCHAFRKTVWKSSTEIWCRLHEEAFAYFGGVPRAIRLDNLKEGVIKPDIYDPQLNLLYTKMLAHHGVVALPCRPYAPDLKGKVESAVGYTQKTALKDAASRASTSRMPFCFAGTNAGQRRVFTARPSSKCARCSKRSDRS
jgi:transposase